MMNSDQFSRHFIYRRQIELMLVIMVLGILAAIAISMFSGDRDKAFAMHVLGDHGRFRQDLVLYYSVNGVWPENKEALNSFVSVFWDEKKTDERPDHSQLIETATIEKGAVHFRFKDHVLGKDKIITLRPAVPANSMSGQVIWVCRGKRDPSRWTVFGEDKTTVPGEIICRFLK